MMLILVLLQLGIGAAVLSTFPAGGRDFFIQVTAGRVADLDGPRNLYEPEAQLKRQSEIRNVPATSTRLLVFNHPPFLVDFLRPLSRLPLETAYRIWLLSELLIFGLAAYLLTAGFAEHGASRWQALLSWLAVLGFFPVVVALAQGQDTAILMLGVAGWSVFVAQRRDLSAGLILSLATIRPHIALSLAIPFVCARRRVLAGFVAGSALLGLYSVSLVGVQGALAYVDLLRESAAGVSFPMGTLRMPNLLGLLNRVGLAGGGEQVLKVAAWVSWAALITTFLVWWHFLQSRVTVLHCGLLLVGSVFFAPHLHIHDTALLAIPPMSVAAARLCGSRSDWEKPVIFMLAASLLLFAAGYSSRSLFDLKLALAMLLILVPLLTDLRADRLPEVGYRSGIANPGTGQRPTSDLR